MSNCKYGQQTLGYTPHGVYPDLGASVIVGGHTQGAGFLLLASPPRKGATKRMRTRATLFLTIIATALLMASGIALAVTNIQCKEGIKCYGTLYDDIITGTAAADYINGQNGNDTVYAKDGADTVYGSLDKDILWGEGGNDKLYGENGDDKLDGGPGDDTLDGSTDNDELYGKEGNDKLYGSIGDDTLDGGPGSNTLYGSSGKDTIKANDTTDSGEDTVYGEDGDDNIDAKDGKKDTIYCGYGYDKVRKDPEDVLPVPGNCEEVTEV